MRIAIVNDMRVTVQLLRRLLITNPEFSLAWIAYDGEEAYEKCRHDTPDLILMDLVMPVLGGAEATRKIMKECPCPILLVTASVGTNASMVFEAMGDGALDAVNTPIIDKNGDIVGKDELFRKIETIIALHRKSTWVYKKQQEPPPIPVKIGKLPNLIVIGASTGGPVALAKLLQGIPKNHKYAITIIQHIDEKFSKGLASWLESQTGHKTDIAQPGGRPTAGVIHVAGTNNHLIINNSGVYEYTLNPIEKSYRPSVDVFFCSVAEYWPNPSIGILLTGMGDDGALGMKALYRKNWETIAQSPSSCVVFGMPKAAIDLGVVLKVLDLEEIPRHIIASPQLKVDHLDEEESRAVDS